MKLRVNKFTYLVFCAVAIVCEVLLDLLSKSWAFSTLGVAEERELLGNILTLHLTYNDGSSFGSLKGQNILFFIITIVGLPLFCYLMWRARTRSGCGRVGFVLCVGGTIGNAYDRAFVETEGEFFGGRVRDFLSYNLPSGNGGYNTLFIGNVADIFLVVGVILAILAIVVFDDDGLVKSFKEEKQRANENN